MFFLFDVTKWVTSNSGYTSSYCDKFLITHLNLFITLLIYEIEGKK